LYENASPPTATTLPRTCFILGKCFCAGLDIFFTSKHVTFSHCKVEVKKYLKKPLAFFRSTDFLIRLSYWGKGWGSQRTAPLSY
jgi:hypothetical protein